MSQFTPESTPSPSSSQFLSEKSAAKIEEFRAKLTQEINAVTTDNTCERFIIARKLDVEKAVKQYLEYLEWHTTPFTDFEISNCNLCPKDLLTIHPDGKEEEFKDLSPCALLGEDKEGSPIIWEKAGFMAKNWSKVKKAFTADEVVVRHIRTQEMMMERCRLNTLKYNEPISKIIVIMDLDGLPVFPDFGALGCIKRFTEMDEARYPETLKTIFVINAPIYFTSIWAVVKPWLDPVTLQKVNIHGRHPHYLEDMKALMDESMIPVEYGGKNEKFSWYWPNNCTDIPAAVSASSTTSTTTKSSSSSSSTAATTAIDAKPKAEGGKGTGKGKGKGK